MVTIGHGFDKIRALVKRELAEVLAAAKDPRIGFLTLMDLKLSPDLRHATVFISPLREDDEAGVLEVLQAHQGHFRSELAKRLRLKRTPELAFRIDELARTAQRIDQLAQQFKAEYPFLTNPEADDQHDCPSE